MWQKVANFKGAEYFRKALYLPALLPKICRAAGTTTYTNHSIRTTTVQELANAGLEAKEIVSERASVQRFAP